MAKYLTLFLPLFFSAMSYSHSGGLDANGCHAGSKPYHCHRAPSEMVGNRLRCDLDSRSKDCVGSTTRSAGHGSSMPTKSEKILNEVWLRCTGAGSPDMLSDPELLETWSRELPDDVDREDWNQFVRNEVLPAILAAGGIESSFEWSETLILKVVRLGNSYVGSISSEKLETESAPIRGESTDSHYQVRVACNEKGQCWDRMDIDRASLAFRRGKRMFTETDEPAAYYVSIDGACEVSTPRI